MRVPYRAAQVALYGSGDDLIIGCEESKKRIIVYDSKAVVSLNWEDSSSSKELFSICVNRTEFLKIVRKGKPVNGFYEIKQDIKNNRCFVFDAEGYNKSKELRNAMIGSLSYKQSDCNQFNWCYEGLVVDQSILTGSVSIDFDRIRQISDFMHNYISAGVFSSGEARVINFIAVNSERPLIIQAFVKVDGGVLCDLDIAIFPFNRGE